MADFLAIAARFDALLHAFIRMSLARRRTIAAGVATSLMGVLRHWTAAGHQGGRQRTERLTIHCCLMRRAMILGERSTFFQLAEAVMGRLVADLGTVADCLDVPVMLVSLIIGTG